MPHESELEFEDRVFDHYVDAFGRDAVERQKYLGHSQRYCDIWIDLEDAEIGLAIEIENDFGAVFKGVGQTLCYASHTDYHHPMIVVPPGHVEQPEAGMLRESVIIQELDV